MTKNNFDGFKFVELIKFIDIEIKKRFIEEYGKDTKVIIYNALDFFKKYFYIGNNDCLYPEIISLLINKYINEFNNSCISNILCSFVDTISQLERIQTNSYKHINKYINNRKDVKNFYYGNICKYNKTYNYHDKKIYKSNDYYILKNQTKYRILHENIKKYECYKKFTTQVESNKNAYELFELLYRHIKLYTNNISPTKLKNIIMNFCTHTKNLITISNHYNCHALYLLFPIDIENFCEKKLKVFQNFYGIVEYCPPCKIINGNILYNDTKDNINNIEFINSDKSIPAQHIRYIDKLLQHAHQANNENESQYIKIHTCLFKEISGLNLRKNSQFTLLIGLFDWDNQKKFGYIDTEKRSKLIQIIKNLSEEKYKLSEKQNYCELIIKILSKYINVEKHKAYYEPSKEQLKKPDIENNIKRYNYDELYENKDVAKLNIYKQIISCFI